MGWNLLATVGFSHYEFGGNRFEVVCAAGPSDREQVAEVLASVLATCAGTDFGYGHYVHGIDRTHPEFFERYRKDSVVFATPFALEDEFTFVEQREDGVFGVLLAVFLDPAETEFLKARRFEALADALERGDANPADLSRPSVV